MKNRTKIVYHPRTPIRLAKPKKTKSFFDITDPKTKEKKKFEYSRDLGEGRYGYVRLFECGDEKIAVKALREDRKKNQKFDPDRRHLTMDEIKKIKEKMETEFEYMQAAYPDEPNYSIHHYHEPESDKDGRVYDCRITMPYVPGKKLDGFTDEFVTEFDDMAVIMLRVAQEMHRLHVESKLIHGDAGARNIMIEEVDRDYKIHLLDFGMSYPVDGYAIVDFEKESSSSDVTSCDMAHERFPNRKLKARPAQDVFSIAKTFWKLIKKREPEWIEEFLSRYPVIKNFIRMGSRKTDWKSRPNLEDFIQNLESNIDWKEHLPSSVNKIAAAIENKQWTKLKSLLKTEDAPDEDLALLLYHLIINQEYNGTRHLIRISENIPVYQSFYGETALHAAAANRAVDPDLFAELLAHISKPDIIDAIHTTNVAGDSVIHTAAKSGSEDVVLELLKYHPDLSTINIEGKTPIETAQPSIKPVLNFFSYLREVENRTQTASPRMFNKTARTKHQKLLEAVYFIEDCILKNNVDEDEYESYRDIIDDTPELLNHVQSLTSSEWLQNADSGFSLFSLIGM